MIRPDGDKSPRRAQNESQLQAPDESQREVPNESQRQAPAQVNEVLKIFTKYYLIFVSLFL
jgi:hypothetical protein